ncbi:unnamed protein product [marine sediment metagenome]|uniref:Integrase SAM-like N-terminal domain-containing protein n=1 Tax=marine sediment metagenome TaxID=412755 RepID=X1EKU3_9ZZZZ
MVIDEVSLLEVRHYLYQWAGWWVKTSGTWTREKIIRWYINSCWDRELAAIGVDVIPHYFIE